MIGTGRVGAFSVTASGARAREIPNKGKVGKREVHHKSIPFQISPFGARLVSNESMREKGKEGDEGDEDIVAKAHKLAVVVLPKEMAPIEEPPTISRELSAFAPEKGGDRRAAWPSKKGPLPRDAKGKITRAPFLERPPTPLTFTKKAGIMPQKKGSSQTGMVCKVPALRLETPPSSLKYHESDGLVFGGYGSERSFTAGIKGLNDRYRVSRQRGDEEKGISRSLYSGKSVSSHETDGSGIYEASSTSFDSTRCPTPIPPRIVTRRNESIVPRFSYLYHRSGKAVGLFFSSVFNCMMWGERRKAVELIDILHPLVDEYTLRRELTEILISLLLIKKEKDHEKLVASFCYSLYKLDFASIETDLFLLLYFFEYPKRTGSPMNKELATTVQAIIEKIMQSPLESSYRRNLTIQRAIGILQDDLSEEGKRHSFIKRFAFLSAELKPYLTRYKTSRLKQMQRKRSLLQAED